MRLGGMFKAYRQIHDLTVTQLAGQMGVSPGVLARLERGDEIRSKQMAVVMLWCFRDGAEAGPVGIGESEPTKRLEDLARGAAAGGLSEDYRAGIAAALEVVNG